VIYRVIDGREYRWSEELSPASGNPQVIEYFSHKLGWRRVNNYDRRKHISDIHHTECEQNEWDDCDPFCSIHDAGECNCR
jgi:hypothetical protein